MSEFIDVEWFDTGATGLPNQTMGIVLIYNEHAGFKCYMGIGNGVSESDDMEHIYKHGTKLNHAIAKAVWGSRMRAEWISRHVADENLTFYKYDDKEYYMNDKLVALNKVATMTQGDIKRIMETQRLAQQLDPLFHALKQSRKKKGMSI